MATREHDLPAVHRDGPSYAGTQIELSDGRISPLTRFVWDEDAPDFRISTKLRTIDPGVITEEDVRRLSEIDPEFAEHRNKYLEENSGKWPMRVIR